MPVIGKDTVTIATVNTADWLIAKNLMEVTLKTTYSNANGHAYNEILAHSSGF